MLETNRIICGDALTVLRGFPSQSVDMSICSPPYWQIRRYLPDDHPDKPLEIGTEQSYNEYVSRLCDVFDEVKRVLKPQGSLWVVMGDQFSGSGGGPPSPYHTKARRYGYVYPKRTRTGIPKKSLCLIPFRFAIETVRRGFICRNVLVWEKLNALPESTRDRFTINFEYFFFFSKSPRYYFEQQLEPAVYLKGMRNKRAVLHVSTTPFTGNHFAAYPEKLVEAPIKAACPPGGIVLDPFSGVSTTACVAKRLGRKYIGIEVNQAYCDLGRERLAAIQASEQ